MSTSAANRQLKQVQRRHMQRALRAMQDPSELTAQASRDFITNFAKDYKVGNFSNVSALAEVGRILATLEHIHKIEQAVAALRQAEMEDGSNG